ncbi:MAG TPA: hypothetical protein VGD60_11480 [Candidatus Acidoferrales bacterium]
MHPNIDQVLAILAATALLGSLILHYAHVKRIYRDAALKLSAAGSRFAAEVQSIRLSSAEEISAHSMALQKLAYFVTNVDSHLQDDLRGAMSGFVVTMPAEIVPPSALKAIKVTKSAKRRARR